jgi:hypothetical protein
MLPLQAMGYYIGERRAEGQITVAGKDDFPLVFARLKKILEPYASRLVVASDTPSSYSLDTAHVLKNKQRLFFGAVRRGKAYVSFHLMPVYAAPELLEGLSPELKKRMQGKSCFNFTAVDERLFKELARLTKAGFARFRAAGYV